jgi:hypothetical protein
MNYIVASEFELNKVNHDGPALKFSAGISVSELLFQAVSGLDLIGIPENTSEIPSILWDYFLSYLQSPVSRMRA